MSDQVGNPEDRFSQNEAQMYMAIFVRKADGSGYIVASKNYT